MARQLAEEAAQREAEQREAAAAARRAREEMQRELRKLQQSFALRLEGNVMLSPPQKVTADAMLGHNQASAPFCRATDVSISAHSCTPWPHISELGSVP